MWSQMANGSVDAKCFSCGSTFTLRINRTSGDTPRDRTYPDNRVMKYTQCEAGFEIRDGDLFF